VKVWEPHVFTLTFNQKRMDYRKINNYLGWIIFIVATTVYFMTLEDTVSLWDCGEYVTAAYKLEVGHPPGAPFFMVLGRLASFFADGDEVAVWINRLSALSSSATILFMFWSITLLVKKIVLMKKPELDAGDKIAIFGSAIVGSLAYTFSDSFWFSAVEGEVYAMASLFTAIIFWAALKWDEEMIKIQRGQLHPKGYSPDRWMLLIMFMLGLAIGVHLLGILVVPAIAYVIYFRYGGISQRFFMIFVGVAITNVVVGIFKMGIGGSEVVSVIFMNAVILGVLYGLYLASKTVKIIEFLLVGLMSIIILSFIQEGVITGSVSFASFLEISFVTSIGLPFFSGTLVFFAILIVLFIYLLRRARKTGNRVFYSSVMGLLLLLIGYCSFAVIVIRSNANTPLDENDPENLVTLHSYLKREQYGSAPLAYGQFWNSKENGGKFSDRGDGQMRWSAGADRSNWDDQSPIHLRRFVVLQDDQVIKAFKSEKAANQFAKEEKGATVEETYFVSNEGNREQATPTYSQNTLFPRMYWSNEPARIDSYMKWSGYNPDDEKGTELGKDGKRLPTFGENMNFFFSYQVNWMYWRYFFWNFSGRQNDIQGSRGGAMRGNWKTGFSFIDDARIGDQSAAPYFTTENESNNSFFLLPLILGLIGIFFHVYRSPKDAFVLFLAFVFTGLAIVVYLNQKPLEPRERDYAYAGSFYFFAMWIGLGVYGLYDAFKNMKPDTWKKLGISAGIGFLFFLFFDLGAPVSMPALIGWITVCLIAGAAVGLMFGLSKVLTKGVHGALVATILGLFIPIIMGFQGWDDHDRSLKTSAHDLAYNYLASCGKNGIIFTNGDNDTFPLWYMQEVEEKFTDVRVCNLSLMQTDWYTNQMKMKAYDSDPLPIKFTEDQILMNYGGTDQVLFSGVVDLLYNGADKNIVEKIIELRVKVSPDLARLAGERLMNNIPQVLSGAQTNSPQLDKQLAQYSRIVSKPIDAKNLGKSVFEKIYIGYKVLGAVNSGTIQIDQSKYSLLREAVINFEDGWDITDLRDAMKFVRNDDNMVGFGAENQMLRIFPSSGFVMPVNKRNLKASGIVTNAQMKDVAKEIRFRFSYDSNKDRLPPSIASQLTISGLTREQVMMLDIIANNNWKRPIYFSSPSGSEVSMALMYGYEGNLSNGHVKQNGMAFELTPLQGRSPRINREKMYDNLMNNYHYGQMSNPDVLTDYYTRRHTVQYRSHFLRLAQEYAEDADNIQTQFYDQGGNDSIAKVQGLPSQKELKEYRARAIKLIKKSLEVMPADVVIDHSEPSTGNVTYRVGEQQYRGYSDGVLYEYIDVLYLAGDKKTANQLANTICTQLETVFNYFDKSDVRIIEDQDNMKDLYAAMDAYFSMYSAVADDQYGEPNSDLAKRMLKQLNNLYSSTLKSIKSELKDATGDNNYRERANTIEEFTNAMAIHYGMLEDPTTVKPVGRPQTGPSGQMPPQGAMPAPPQGAPAGMPQ